MLSAKYSTASKEQAYSLFFVRENLPLVDTLTLVYMGGVAYIIISAQGELMSAEADRGYIYERL